VVAAKDSTPPYGVSITSPGNGASIKGTKVTVSATASDNVGVAKVELYADGALIGTDTSTPYSFNWNIRRLSTGAHQLQVKAYDAAGNATLSAITTVNK